MDPDRPQLFGGGRGQAGAFALVNVLVLAVVVVAAGVAALLLARTMVAAQSISDDAATIARTGRGINVATDSVIALSRTNDLARAIRDHVAPLDEDLAAIIETAGDVDSTAGSINQTASGILTLAIEIDRTATTIDDRAATVNGIAGTILTEARRIELTAEDIDDAAQGINTEAAEIIDVAQRIDADVVQINQNLDVTIALAGTILEDTGDILSQARGAHVTTACIDDKLGGGPDGHCAGDEPPAGG